jgi:hypothetical protein
LRESGAKLLDFCHTAKLNSTIFSSDIVGCNFFFNYIWAINN